MEHEVMHIKLQYGKNVPPASESDFDNLAESPSDSDSSVKTFNIGQRVLEATNLILCGKHEFSGWANPQLEEKELSTIKEAATRIRKESELLVVIGIGGSYLGAKAVIEALAPEKVVGGISWEGFPLSEENEHCCGLQIAFAGNNLSGHYHQRILKLVKEKETSLCVISKSGTTAEPALVFGILKEAMLVKYGETEANRRIYAITDKSKGTLRGEAEIKGYTSFEVPENIGGRYSVLTAVGLLPIAAAGIDIDKLLKGAGKICEDIKECLGCKDFIQSCKDPKTWCCEACKHLGECEHKCVQYLKYAVARFTLSNKTGHKDLPKTVEIFEYYEPRLSFFAEWLKQLFGESEGKDGKGIFPVSMVFSTELHSMGQFLQEGRQIFFETLLDVQDTGCDIKAVTVDSPILAHSMNEVERAATEGVINAHEKTGIPIIRISIPRLNEFIIGELIYFFEINCAVAALLSGVNPFNQPGVEAYKSEMKSIL